MSKVNGSVEDFLVAVGRTQHRHHPIALRNRAGRPSRRRPSRCASSTRPASTSAAPLRRRWTAALRRRGTARSASGLATNACSPTASAFFVVSLPAKVSTKKKISSSLAGTTNCSPSSPVMTAEVSVLQMSSVGLRRFSAVSSSAYAKMVPNSSSMLLSATATSGDVGLQDAIERVEDVAADPRRECR